MTTTGARIGVMGGTFDPIHHAHLVAADEAAARLGLNEVVFIPTGRPWQKAAAGVSDAEHRYAMTLLATADHPLFRVSRLEIDRPGRTYTIDTVRGLREEYDPDTELFFITGADTLANLHTWRSVGDVVAATAFVTVNRPGWRVDVDRLPDGIRLTAIDMPGLDISSTAIRARIAAGEPIRYLVPNLVASYITRHGLYRQPHGET